MASASEQLEAVLSARRATATRQVPTHGFSAAWLSRAFDMDVKSVQKRLTRCPSRPSPDNRGTLVYDLKDAARYLVEPNLSAEDFMKLARRADLPPTLQQQFWDAMLKRQQYEAKAGDLWPTDRVRDVLRETFQTMKFTMQLWADTLAREESLTPQQREIIVRLVDGLQAEIYESLVKQIAVRKSGPQLADMAPVLEGATPPTPDSDEDDDDTSFI